MRLRHSVLAAALALTLATPAIAAEQLWGLTVNNNLVNFLSTNPWAFSSRPITGMAPGEFALGIDFRPALPVGRLYALSNLGQLYRIDDPNTGTAVAVGPGGIVLSGTDFGIDFNPTVDRIRVISDAGQNLRLNPDTGVLAATDLAIAYAGGDPNAGADADATGAAYTNNVAGAVSTVLYDIDSALNLLVTQAPPNNGALNTVGPLGIDVTGVNGFDISGMTATAFAALNTGGVQSGLYQINLATGTATSLGVIGCAEAVRGLSVDPNSATPALGMTWGRIKSIYR